MWNAALFLRLGLPSTLIRHENGTFWKRSSNRRNLQTLALCLSVDGRHSGVVWTALTYRFSSFLILVLILPLKKCTSEIWIMSPTFGFNRWNNMVNFSSSTPKAPKWWQKYNNYHVIIPGGFNNDVNVMYIWTWWGSWRFFQNLNENRTHDSSLLLLIQVNLLLNPVSITCLFVITPLADRLNEWLIGWLVGTDWRMHRGQTDELADRLTDSLFH